MTPSLLLAAVLFLAPPAAGPDWIGVTRVGGAARLVGSVGGAAVDAPLDGAPASVAFHPDGHSVLLGYPGSPSRIVRYDLAAKAGKEWASLDGHLARFTPAPSGGKVAAAVRRNPDFGTGEILLVGPGGKTERLCGGDDDCAYDCPRFADETTLLFNRSRLPDPEVPKFDRIEVCRLTLADRKVVPLAGGATVFDGQGNPSGFKASEPSPLPGGAVGFMKTVGHVDKTYCLLGSPGAAPKEVTAVEESMVEPRAAGAFAAWLEIEPGEEAGRLVALPLAGGEKRTLADGVVCFDLK